MLANECFDALARRYMDMVYRIAFSMTKNRADADDISQNVLLKLYKTDKAFRDEEHRKSWLIRVTVNECRRLWRSPWRKTEPLEEYAALLPFEDARESEVFLAVMGLDAKYRAVVVLYYYEGYSLAEIAGLLGIPAATAGTRLARARAKLKTILQEADCCE